MFVPTGWEIAKPLVGFVLWGSRLARFLKAHGVVGAVKRRAALSYLTLLHQNVVHDMRTFAQCAHAPDAIGPTAEALCNSCRDLFCDLHELAINQLHCSIKIIDEDGSGNAIIKTLARATPADSRPNVYDGHPVVSDSVWCSLLGVDDGNTRWEVFNCFSSNDLAGHSHYVSHRPDYQKYYRSTVVFPIRYLRSTEKHDFVTVGFLAFDSPKVDAFSRMPEILDKGVVWADFHDRLKDQSSFHAGAMVVDCLAYFLRRNCRTRQ